MQTLFFIFNTNARFLPFLLYVRYKSGVTFLRRSLRDDVLVDRLELLSSIWYTEKYINRKNKQQFYVYQYVILIISFAMKPAM